MGLLRGRRAPVGVPRSRQPGAGAGRRRGPGRLRPPRDPSRTRVLDDRRAAGPGAGAVAGARRALGNAARGPVGPAAPRAGPRAGGGAGPAGAALGAGGRRRALPGVRGHVHRGGRHLPGVGRRSRPLPRPGQPAGEPGLVVRALRAGPRGLQGRGRVRVAQRLPDPGRVRRPLPPRRGPGRGRHGRGRADRAEGDRAGRVVVRQRAQRAPRGRRTRRVGFVQTGTFSTLMF